MRKKILSLAIATILTPTGVLAGEGQSQTLYSSINLQVVDLEDTTGSALGLPASIEYDTGWGLGIALGLDVIPKIQS